MCCTVEDQAGRIRRCVVHLLRFPGDTHVKLIRYGPDLPRGCKAAMEDAVLDLMARYYVRCFKHIKLGLSPAADGRKTET